MTSPQVPDLALTLIQPMGWAIVHGHKSVENRPRNIIPIALRGKRFTAAIHNGAKWDDHYAFVTRTIAGVVPAPEPMSIIGIATFTGRVYTANDRPTDPKEWAWWMGPFGFQIDPRESIALERPIPCRGMLGFWRLRPDVKTAIAAQLGPSPKKTTELGACDDGR